MQRLTTARFVEKAKAIHGPRYDYSLVDYKTNKKKVKIICPEHGEFMQTPHSHLEGKGCLSCARKRRKGVANKSNLKTTEYFVEKARLVHGDKYEYTRTEYRRSTKPVIITCPEHGDFSQVSSYHLQGNGCPQCHLHSKRLTRKRYIDNARKIHGDEYSYGDLVYTTAHEKVDITCRVHGNFSMRAADHVNGQRCPKCSGGNRPSNGECEVFEFLKRVLN